MNPQEVKGERCPTLFPVADTGPAEWDYRVLPFPGINRVYFAQSSESYPPDPFYVGMVYGSGKTGISSLAILPDQQLYGGVSVFQEGFGNTLAGQVKYATAKIPSAFPFWEESNLLVVGTQAPILATGVTPTIVGNVVRMIDIDSAERKFEGLFRCAREVDFEDGMENEFAKDLTVMVQENGPRTKEILARLLENPAISPNVFSEALRWLGRMEDKPSHEARRWILEKALTSPAPQTRNGALIGLSSMDDPHAIHYLESAMKGEKIDLVRRSMKKVVDQLTNR